VETRRLIARIFAVSSLAFLISASAQESPLLAAPEPKVKVELRRAETEPAEGLTEATVEGTKRKVYLHKEAEITNEDIASAKVVADEGKDPFIEITFTKAGQKKIAKLTRDHKDKPLAILVDDKVISAPLVKSEISEKANITGKFTKDEAERIVKGLKGD
jgi:preprotein translocase subunit SecD